MNNFTRNEIDALLAEWAEKHTYITGEELRQRLGLSPEEWRAATFFDKVIPQISVPQELWEQLRIYQTGYYDPHYHLNDHDRATINYETIITKEQACTRLQIRPRTFDTWKQRVGLKPAAFVQQGTRRSVYGYRQSEIDDMGRKRAQAKR